MNTKFEISDDDFSRYLIQLHTLLTDPHPGLFTWQQLRAELGKKILIALKERLEEYEKSPGQVTQ